MFKVFKESREEIFPNLISFREIGRNGFKIHYMLIYLAASLLLFQKGSLTGCMVPFFMVFQNEFKIEGPFLQ